MNVRCVGLLVGFMFVSLAGCSEDSGVYQGGEQANTPEAGHPALKQLAFALQTDGMLHVLTNMQEEQARQIVAAKDELGTVERAYWHVQGTPGDFASMPKGVKLSMESIPVLMSYHVRLPAVPEFDLPARFHVFTFNGTEQPDFTLQVVDYDADTGHISLSWSGQLRVPFPDPALSASTITFHETREVDTIIVKDEEAK